MRVIAKSAVLAVGLAAAVAAPHPAFAQAASPAAPAQAGAELKQIPLTQALVDQYLSAKKDVDAVLDKLPDGTDQPDPATLKKLDTVAKSHKFDDYGQYDTTDTNIGIVMAGMDPATKQYVGPEAVIKKQIADLQADKNISAKDKKDTLDQLNAALPGYPALQYKDNIKVVVANYDKLNALSPQD